MKRQILQVPLYAAIIASLGLCIQSENKTPEFETETEALEALAFFSDIHAYPDAEVAPGSFARAYENYRKNFASSGSVRDDESFTNVGPNNVGGRTISIAIDPADTSIIYVGSAGGGLWKSVTGGIGTNAWQNIPTGYEVCGVGAIAINPSNSNTLYIGTGETYSYGTNSMGIATRTERGSYGIGILKSTDGGSSWTKSLDWSYQENRGVWEIIFDPADSNTVYAATTEGIYKTTDGGSIWNLMLDVKMVMDMEINKTDPDILYAGVGNLSSEDKGIYRSEDGGLTWELLTSGLPAYTQDGRITISAYAGDYNKLWAIIGNVNNTVGIYFSDDAGDSWSLIDETDIVSYQGWYAKGLVIQKDDPNKILAGGVEVFRSLNAGNTWTQLTTYTGPFSIVHPDIHNIIANPLDKNKVYIICDGGLYRSNDFGNSFYSCNDGLVTSQFYIGSISHQTNDIGLGGLQDNFIQRYTGSVYWDAMIGGDGCYNAINFENDYIQYASTQYLNVIRSTDQGENFFEYMGTGSSSAFLAPYAMSESDPEILYAGKNGLVRTTNGGDTWSSTGPANVDGLNPIIAIGISPSDPDIVYFATAPVDNDADVFVSTNGGITNTKITGELPDRYPRDIAVNKSDPDEVYICYAGFGAGHIFKSINAGADWSDISSTLPDIPFHTILIDPYDEKILYAGSDITLFVSKNKGESWEAYNAGLPEAAMIFDIQFSPADTSLFLYTHGRGVFNGPLATKEDTTIISVNEIQDILPLGLYPNVVSDHFTINLKDKITGNIEMQLFTMNGELAMRNNYTLNQENELQISCTDIPSGNYILHLKYMDKTFSEKLVKM